jgi:hypothetical protein
VGRAEVPRGIVAVLAMSDHWHLVVHDYEGVLPAFMRYLHGLSARVINVIRGRWENLWSTEQVNINHAKSNQRARLSVTAG